MFIGNRIFAKSSPARAGTAAKARRDLGALCFMAVLSVCACLLAALLTAPAAHAYGSATGISDSQLSSSSFPEDATSLQIDKSYYMNIRISYSGSDKNITRLRLYTQFENDIVADCEDDYYSSSKITQRSTHVKMTALGTLQYWWTATTQSGQELTFGPFTARVERQDPKPAFEHNSQTVTYGDALTQNKLTFSGSGAVAYASDNASVATVDSSTGAITLVGAGTATITATVAQTDKYQKGTASYKLTVKRRTPVCQFANSTVSVSYGSTVPSNPLTYDGDGTVKYSTSYSYVGTVNSSTGIVTANAAGTTTITAKTSQTSKYEAATATYKLTVSRQHTNIPQAIYGLVYNGSAQRGVPPGAEYTLSGTAEATDAGTYTCTASLKDGDARYQWSDGSTEPKEITWSIARTSISYANIDPLDSCIYDGTEWTPYVYATFLGERLWSDDYDVSYYSNVKAGKGRVVIRGMGNFKGSVTKYFTIKPAPLSQTSIALSKKKYAYNGKKRTPGTTVLFWGNKLKKGRDYTVSVSGSHKAVGTYKVTIKGKGNFKGSKKLTFKIVPSTPKIKSLKFRQTWSASGVALTWKKVKGCSGYQLRVSTSPTFSGASASKKTSKTSYKMKLRNSRLGKTVYCKVRAYKTVKGKKYYSEWSATKHVNTRK